MSTESLEDELDRLRKEEKTRLHADLARLSVSIDNLSQKVAGLAHQSDVEKLATIMGTLAKEVDLKNVESRVDSLENYKWLVIGGVSAVAGLQTLQAFFAWLLKTPAAQ